MTEVHKAARPLLELQPKYAFFVGIDSDGCAFDTMEIKHKECFTPNTIKHWDLQPVSKYAREAALFVVVMLNHPNPEQETTTSRPVGNKQRSHKCQT